MIWTPLFRPREDATAEIGDGLPWSTGIGIQRPGSQTEEKKAVEKVSSDGDGGEEDGSVNDDEEDSEDDDENTVSAVMEQALLPDILSKFDAIKRLTPRLTGPIPSA